MTSTPTSWGLLKQPYKQESPSITSNEKTSNEKDVGEASLGAEWIGCSLRPVTCVRGPETDWLETARLLKLRAKLEGARCFPSTDRQRSIASRRYCVSSSSGAPTRNPRPA